MNSPNGPNHEISDFDRVLGRFVRARCFLEVATRSVEDMADDDGPADEAVCLRHGITVFDKACTDLESAICAYKDQEQEREERKEDEEARIYWEEQARTTGQPPPRWDTRIVTRRIGEFLAIGTTVKVTVVGIEENQVKLAVEAPHGIPQRPAEPSAHREDDGEPAS